MLEAGDYDQAYLEELKTKGFPPEKPIAPLEYEDHQPPLYYLIMAVIYVTFDPAQDGPGQDARATLLALRLASLALGAGIVACAYVLAGELFPERPFLALTTAGFVAFVPQHVAVMAGVSNDSLAGLIAGLALILLVRYIRPREAVPRGYVRETHGEQIGVVIGLGFLTKTTIYFLPFLAALALVWRWRQEGWTARRAAREALRMFLPALLLGALWWGRNLAVYGWPDFFALQRHEAVVIGQPRTVEWIAQLGPAEVVRRLLLTTFNSWWGQFGWMGVVMDRRVYLALLIFTLGIGAGLMCLLFARRIVSLSTFERKGVALLALTLFSSLALYLGYNATFVQHQGRYLFSAIIPTALGAAAGLSAYGLVAARVFKRPLAWLPLMAIALMAVLDVFALFRFIVPALK